MNSNIHIEESWESVQAFSPVRRWLLLTIFLLVVVALLSRMFFLQLVQKDFHKEHGDARAVRVVEIPAHRGMITDRNGDPLAISTPVQSIWATPKKVLAQKGSTKIIAEVLGLQEAKLNKLLKERIGRDFVYLKRHADPEVVKTLHQHELSGVHFENEYRRYYPAAEVTGHIIGFNNVDDHGQEGLELAYDAWLSGKPGAKRVLKDRLGRIVEDIESIRPSQPGKHLPLSIDRRIQYLAYRELKAAVHKHKARGGSLVMLDAHTGEVMAMVGQPSYNPNNRSGLRSDRFRNRAVTDVFEPGSTLKPFTVIAGLNSGLYEVDTEIDTRPGYFKVGQHTVRDIHNYGLIDVATVISKSSNVGSSKIALSLEPSHIYETFKNFGFGQTTGSGFPGEASGVLTSYQAWSDVHLATLAFGYGISVTPLQLAHAYAVIAADGMSKPISFVKVEEDVEGHQVMDAKVAQDIRAMLETVVSVQGTGRRAGVKGYRIVGKTGTVHKSTQGGYSEDRYLSLFAGIAPASNPRFAMVVIIDEPGGGQYFGGQVAAPVFSNVMAGTLRITNTPLDDISAFSKQIITKKPMLKFDEVIN